MCKLIWLFGEEFLERQYGFRPYRGRILSLSLLQRLIESSGSSERGLYAVHIDLEPCFGRIPRRKLWRPLRKRGLPRRFVFLFRNSYLNTCGRVRAEEQLGPWFKVACGVRQGSVEGPILPNIYMDCMMREVLRRHPHKGVASQHRLDGRWPDAANIAYETSIACLMYADYCALVAASEVGLQGLSITLAEEFKAGGLSTSIATTEVSVYRAWTLAPEGSDPQLTHANGAKVKKPRHPKTSAST